MTVSSRSVLLAATLVFGVAVSPGLAQDQPYDWSEEWEWQATPSAMSPAMPGVMMTG